MILEVFDSLGETIALANPTVELPLATHNNEDLESVLQPSSTTAVERQKEELFPSG
jgi:hypothetical protein